MATAKSPYRLQQAGPVVIPLTATGYTHNEVRMAIAGAAAVVAVGVVFGLLVVFRGVRMDSQVDELSFALVFAALLGGPLSAWLATAPTPLRVAQQGSQLTLIHGRTGAVVAAAPLSSLKLATEQWQGTGRGRSLVPLTTVSISHLRKSPLVLGCVDARHTWDQEPQEGAAPDYWVVPEDWPKLIEALGLGERALFVPERQEELLRKANYL